MDPGHERLVALDIRQAARLLFAQTQQLPEIRPYCSSAASLPMHAVHDEEHGHARKRHFAHSAPKRAHFYRSALLFERCGVKVVPHATSRRASPSAFTTCDSTLYGAAMAAVQQCGMRSSAIKARLSLSARFVPLALDPY